MDQLLELFEERWLDLDKQLKTLRQEIHQTTLNPAAVVASADPVYATMAALPSNARLGWRATVIDDGSGSPAPVWHDGTSWRKVTTI